MTTPGFGELDTAPVNGAAVLDAVRVFIRRYVVLSDAQLDALALWVLHTWALAAFDVTPYLEIGSAEKRSGKSRLLETLGLVVCRPWLTGRASAAVLVRKIERDSPTLLLDESDAAFKGDQEYAETLRGVLNGGHRRGGVVSLCVKAKADFELRDFSVFCPKAIAGIGKLPDTVSDRAIRIEMRRRSPSERVERFRSREAEAEAEAVREGLRLWAAIGGGDLRDARPPIPEALDDRAADGWEPLLAIAEAVGGDWRERARAAALQLSAGAGREDESLGVRLLADIREVLAGHERMASSALAVALAEIEESPWGDMHGRPLDARRLARRLKDHGIAPHNVRLGDGKQAKGYAATDFEDAWARYLPPVCPEEPSQPSHRPKAPFSDSDGWDGQNQWDGHSRPSDSYPSHDSDSEVPFWDGGTAGTANTGNALPSKAATDFEDAARLDGQRDQPAEGDGITCPDCGDKVFFGAVKCRDCAPPPASEASEAADDVVEVQSWTR